MLEAACAFNDAAGSAYHFVYDMFCDWYVEITKPIPPEVATRRCEGGDPRHHRLGCATKF